MPTESRAISNSAARANRQLRKRHGGAGGPDGGPTRSSGGPASAAADGILSPSSKRRRLRRGVLLRHEARMRCADLEHHHASSVPPELQQPAVVAATIPQQPPLYAGTRPPRPPPKEKGGAVRAPALPRDLRTADTCGTGDTLYTPSTSIAAAAAAAAAAFAVRSDASSESGSRSAGGDVGDGRERGGGGSGGGGGGGASASGQDSLHVALPDAQQRCDRFNQIVAVLRDAAGACRRADYGACTAAAATAGSGNAAAATGPAPITMAAVALASLGGNAGTTTVASATSAVAAAKPTTSASKHAKRGEAQQQPPPNNSDNNNYAGSSSNRRPRVGKAAELFHAHRFVAAKFAELRAMDGEAFLAHYRCMVAEEAATAPARSGGGGSSGESSPTHAAADFVARNRAPASPRAEVAAQRTRAQSRRNRRRRRARERRREGVLARAAEGREQLVEASHYRQAGDSVAGMALAGGAARCRSVSPSGGGGGGGVVGMEERPCVRADRQILAERQRRDRAACWRCVVLTLRACASACAAAAEVCTARGVGRRGGGATALQGLALSQMAASVAVSAGGTAAEPDEMTRGVQGGEMVTSVVLRRTREFQQLLSERAASALRAALRRRHVRYLERKASMLRCYLGKLESRDHFRLFLRTFMNRIRVCQRLGRRFIRMAVSRVRLWELQMRQLERWVLFVERQYFRVRTARDFNRSIQLFDTVRRRRRNEGPLLSTVPEVKESFEATRRVELHIPPQRMEAALRAYMREKRATFYDTVEAWTALPECRRGEVPRFHYLAPREELVDVYLGLRHALEADTRRRVDHIFQRRFSTSCVATVAALCVAACALPQQAALRRRQTLAVLRRSISGVPSGGGGGGGGVSVRKPVRSATIVLSSGQSLRPMTPSFYAPSPPVEPTVA